MPIVFREAVTRDLDEPTLAAIIEVCHACWPSGDFSDEDFAHALGGRHFLAEAGGRVVSHASVVPRSLELDGGALRAGYVEAVATLPEYRRRGMATRLVEAANAHIAAEFELGALSTGVPAFYERLGWRRWRGGTWVRELDGSLTRTADDDDGILILPTPATPQPNLNGRLVCDWRPGDVW